jgi:predicted ArsR family transcriptional regulator
LKTQTSNILVGQRNRDLIVNLLKSYPNTAFSAKEIAGFAGINSVSIRAHLHFLTRDRQNNVVFEFEGRKRHRFYYSDRVEESV